MLTPREHAVLVASQMTEAVLQARVIAVAKALDWRHFHAPANRPGGRAGRVQTVAAGFPDLVLVHARQRRILYRELKRQNGRVQPEQREWLADLEAAGADVGIWRPEDYLDGTVMRQLALPPRRTLVPDAPFPPAAPAGGGPMPHDRQVPTDRHAGPSPLSGPDPRVDPDCAMGKHAACSGGAWDEVEDAPTFCRCSCHK